MGVPDRESLTVTTYLAEKERSVWLIRFLMRSICISPDSSKTVVDRVLAECSVCTCCSLMLLTTVSMGLAIFVENRGDADILMLNIGPFCYYIMTIMKYICLVLNANNIRICVDYVQMDWNTAKSIEDQKVMLKNAKVGRLIATVLAMFMHTSVQGYSITKCIFKNVVEIDNVSVTIRDMPYPFYHEILDVNFSPAYEIAVIVQCLSSFILCGVTNAICGLMAIFVMHACGQLKILTLWFNDIVHDDDVMDIDTIQQKMGFIVERHLRVINFVSRIEKIICLTCLVEVVGCSSMLCLLGYCSMMAWNNDKKQNIPTYCAIAVSFTMNIFIICYIAEIFSEQYKRVGMESYMIKWYRLPPKTALGLLLINLRCSLHANLSAGKMIDLSLYSFGNVLKTSVAYLNMLRQMNS